MSISGLRSTEPRPKRLMLAQARWRSLWLRRPLPPGDLLDIDRSERSDRRLLLRLATQHGPIFKGLSDDRLLVCVVGLVAGRKLLRQHADDLQPVTLQLQSLFPLGFLRQMEGTAHRQVRRALVGGLNAVDLRSAAGDWEDLVASELRTLRGAGPVARPDARQYAALLGNIATAMLLRLFFGSMPGQPAFDRLVQGFRQLGPNGLLWNIGDKQAVAFVAIRDALRVQMDNHARQTDPSFGQSLLGHLMAAGPVDETLLGNLIYMVEMGRYDLRGLLRWISRHAADHPDWVERVATRDPLPGSEDFATAFVLETLRMDQSERLMRRVKRDIVFDGYLIPRDALLRVCMWEAHKADPPFVRPFDFDPSRFCGVAPTGEQFSPFGLDHHHCPFSQTSVLLTGSFLRVLARSCRLQPEGGGAAVRGAYHWEPAPDFTVALHWREEQEAH